MRKLVMEGLFCKFCLGSGGSLPKRSMGQATELGSLSIFIWVVRVKFRKNGKGIFIKIV